MKSFENLIIKLFLSNKIYFFCRNGDNFMMMIILGVFLGLLIIVLIVIVVLFKVFCRCNLEIIGEMMFECDVMWLCLWVCYYFFCGCSFFVF